MLGHIGLVRGVFVVSARTQFIAQKYLLAGFGVVWYIQACRIFPVFFSFVFRVLENDFELFVLRVCAIFLLVSWCRADDVFFTFHLLFGCFVVAYILFRGCVSLVVSLCPFYSLFFWFHNVVFCARINVFGRTSNDLRGGIFLVWYLLSAALLYLVDIMSVCCIFVVFVFHYLC